ncbi:MAG: hypothetical protein DRI69_03550 [Bacteroidetes bacterium]|nr:MAG: hypothetical protein DRI69_03550 [Bacteroidota bacterium]
MNTTKLAICTLVGTIFLFLTDYLWFVLLMGGGGTGDAGPAMQWMILGYLLLALTFCMVYAKGVESGSATQQGLKFGILAGIMVYVSTNLMWLSFADMSPCIGEELGINVMDTIKNSLYYVVQMGILGIVVAHLSGLSAGDGVLRGETGGTKDRPGPEPPPPKGTEG